jgi:mannose/fructose/N-acetylgalactosamine-specific phosphotransferase system component IID
MKVLPHKKPTSKQKQQQHCNFFNTQKHFEKIGNTFFPFIPSGI